MWRLTIYQKYKYSYMYEGKRHESEGENSISFESKYCNELFEIVAELGELEATDETRYEIRKVVE